MAVRRINYSTIAHRKCAYVKCDNVIAVTTEWKKKRYCCISHYRAQREVGKTFVTVGKHRYSVIEMRPCPICQKPFPLTTGKPRQKVCAPKCAYTWRSRHCAKNIARLTILRGEKKYGGWIDAMLERTGGKLTRSNILELIHHGYKDGYDAKTRLLTKRQDAA